MLDVSFFTTDFTKAQR